MKTSGITGCPVTLLIEEGLSEKPRNYFRVMAPGMEKSRPLNSKTALGSWGNRLQGYKISHCAVVPLSAVVYNAYLGPIAKETSLFVKRSCFPNNQLVGIF